MGLIKDLFPNVFELMPKVTRAPHGHNDPP